jgi:hypothetical protein
LSEDVIEALHDREAHVRQAWLTACHDPPVFAAVDPDEHHRRGILRLMAGA